jgi:hypothetical protein
MREVREATAAEKDHRESKEARKDQSNSAQRYNRKLKRTLGFKPIKMSFKPSRVRGKDVKCQHMHGM